MDVSTRSIALTKFGMTARAHEGRDTKREPNAQRPTTTSRSWHNAGRWVRTTTPANAKNRWLPWNQFIVILILSIVVDSPILLPGPYPSPSDLRGVGHRTARRVAPRATREAPEAPPAVLVEPRPLVVGVVPMCPSIAPSPCGPKAGPKARTAAPSTPTPTRTVDGVVVGPGRSAR